MELEQLLVQHQAELLRFVQREGRGLLLYESAEDLAQGVCANALRSQTFEYRGEREFFAWLWTLARRHIADRHAYWHAMKRGAGKVLRISSAGRSTPTGSAVDVPAPSGRSPSSAASQREMIIASARALAALPARDRALVRWRAFDVPLAEQAERLGISYQAVQKAGERALERYRKLLSLTGLE